MPFVPGAVMRHPKLTLSSTTSTPPLTAVEIQCFGRGITLKPTQEVTKYRTFCGSFSSASDPEWELTLKAYISYGTGAMWNTLAPLAGEIIDFELIPDGDKAVGVDNPVATGQVTVPYISFMEGEEGSPSEVDIVMPVEGQPEFAESDVFAATAEVSA